MRAMRWLAMALALCAIVVVATRPQRVAATTYGSVNLSWHTVPLINLTITPNYQTGYGPTGGTGSGSTPAPGPNASAGWIDFGNAVQGYNYLYKYALKASVMTNDLNGFEVYAEGATNANGQTDATTMPLNQTLYWLVSSTSNNPFTSATPFQPTTGTTTGCATNNVGPCSIAYLAYPAAIWNYPNETIGQTGNIVSQGYDYELRLSNASDYEVFDVIIVYTAVGN